MNNNQHTNPLMISEPNLWEELDDEKQSQIKGGISGVAVDVTVSDLVKVLVTIGDILKAKDSKKP